MATSKRVLDIARSQLGYKESGSNRTKYGKWYGMDGAAWCDMFVSWVFAQAGATSIGGKFAYTPSHADWFRKKGRFGKKAYVGSVAFFNFPGDGVNRISHVGIVEAVHSDGTVTVIEGNTSGTGSQRNGGMVMRKRRSLKLIVGFGYPRYDKPAPKPVAKPKPAAKVATGPVLNLGDKGKYVTRLQKRLVAHGIKVKIDGDFGPATKKAVVSFQKKHKLVADGVVGSKTWAKLG